MSDWYLFENGRQVGPLPEPDAFDALRGKDLARVKVWHSGLQGWVAAEDIPGIRNALAWPAAVSAPVSPQAKPLRRRKWSWAHNLALLGAFLAGAHLAFGADRREMPQDTAEAIGFAIGAIGAITLLAALIGFALGIIADFGRGRPARRSEPQAVGGWRTILVRHLRGDLPLWASFWGIGIAAIIAAAIFIALSGMVFGKDSIESPLTFFCVLVAFYAVLLVLLVWQVVGIWRSARRHETVQDASGRDSTGAGLAKAAISVAVAMAGFVFVMGPAPQLAEAYRIAFLNDPGIPAYAIRVMRDGTEMEISGGIKFGLAAEVEKVLGENPGIRVVHLTSGGGRLIEARAVHRLIRARDLDTYVASECLSACTLVFAGGRHRYLRNGAQLGFHRGAFAGHDEDGVDEFQRDVFLASGFDQAFVERAASTPNREMWRPSSDTLLAARVVTSMRDGSQVAASSFGDPTKRN